MDTNAQSNLKNHLYEELNSLCLILNEFETKKEEIFQYGYESLKIALSKEELDKEDIEYIDNEIKETIYDEIENIKASLLKLDFDFKNDETQQLINNSTDLMKISNNLDDIYMTIDKIRMKMLKQEEPIDDLELYNVEISNIISGAIDISASAATFFTLKKPSFFSRAADKARTFFII